METSGSPSRVFLRFCGHYKFYFILNPQIFGKKIREKKSRDHSIVSNGLLYLPLTRENKKFSGMSRDSIRIPQFNFHIGTYIIDDRSI